MAHRVIWSNRAVDDLNSIAEYIAQDSEAYAASVVRTILHKVSALAEFSSIGRIVPEFEDASIREIFAYSYRIIYKIKGNEIHVAAVVHGRRLLGVALDP